MTTKLKPEKRTAYEKKFLAEMREQDKAGTAKYMPAEEAKKYGDWSRAQLKSERITMRVNGLDLARAKEIAMAKGKKYQTLLGEIIHRGLARAA